MTIVKQQHYDVLPVGEYPARIAAVDPAEGQFGPQLKFTFALEGEHADREMLGWCSQSFSPKSKLYAWTRAAFGKDTIPSDYDLNSEHLIGRSVRLVLVTKTGDDGTEYNKIDSLKPRNGAPAPAVTPASQRVRVNDDEGQPWPDSPPPDDGDGWPF